MATRFDSNCTCCISSSSCVLHSGPSCFRVKRASAGWETTWRPPSRAQNHSRSCIFWPSFSLSPSALSKTVNYMYHFSDIVVENCICASVMSSRTLLLLFFFTNMHSRYTHINTSISMNTHHSHTETETNLALLMRRQRGRECMTQRIARKE